jgi:small conductance mechanosensitive channel
MTDMALKPDRSAQMRDMFKTRSHSWAEVGLSRQISVRAARRARRQAAVLLPALAGILVVYSYRVDLFGTDFDFPVRVVTVIALVILGWAFARDIGRAVGPAMFRRMDPATAGTVGFLLRLLTIGIALIVALHVAGLDPATLAVGGAVTAVVLGLAAQQTLGNVFAGTVLLSARPFRVGDRVRLQGGPVAGHVEGVVSSLGLLYLTLASGDDSIMVPNSVVLSMAVIPLREPEGVDLRARLPAEVRPSDVQEVLEEAVTVPTRYEPRIVLEELDGDEVVVRIAATPQHAAEGPKLANEILSAIGGMVRDGANGANSANSASGDSPIA